MVLAVAADLLNFAGIFCFCLSTTDYKMKEGELSQD